MQSSVAGSEAETTDNNALAFFLSDPHAIMSAIRKSICKIAGYCALIAIDSSSCSKQMDRYDDVLMDLLTFCATQFEAGAYVLPFEKHALVRSIVYSLCLLDDGERDVRQALKRRKVNIDRFIKIMRVFTLVLFCCCLLFIERLSAVSLAAVYGDMTRTPDMCWLSRRCQPARARVD